MEEVLVLVDETPKKVSLNSSDPADKLRLSIATLISLMNNLNNGKIPQGIRNYNNACKALIAAIQEEENAKALSEVQKSIGIKDEFPFVSPEDSKLLKATSDWVLKDKFEYLSIALGNNDEQPKTGVKDGFLAKKIKINEVQKAILQAIGNKKKDLFVEPIKDEQKKSVNETPTDTIPNWERLFAGAEEIDFNLLTSKNANKKEFKTSKDDILTSEELKRRVMIIKIYEDLLNIRSKINSQNGVVSIFEKGLQDRESNLIAMFSEIIGVNLKKAPIKNNEYQKTEIQQVIDNVVGYIEPKTEEERKAMQKNMDYYYSDPLVQQAIEDLKLKNVLFDLNDRDSYNAVMNAELKHAQTLAEQAIDERKFFSTDEMLKAAKEQAKSLFKEAEKQDFLQKGALEQANMLKTLQDFMAHKGKEDKFMKEEAFKQALSLHNNNQLIDGAEKQAQLLNENYKKQEKSLYLNKEAEKQAQSIMEYRKRVKLQQENNENIVGMLIQASKQYKNNDINNDLRDAAFNQALSLHNHNQLIDAATDQAKVLHENNMLIDGAEKQAQLIIDYSELKEQQNNGNFTKNDVQKKYLNIDGVEGTNLGVNYLSIDGVVKPLKLSNGQWSTLRGKLGQDKRFIKSENLWKSISEDLQHLDFLKRDINIEQQRRLAA